MKKNTVGLLLGLMICSLTHAQAWVPLGPGDDNLPVQAFGANQVVFIDAADTAYTIYYDKLINNGVTVRKFNGTAWESLGHAATVSTAINEFVPAPVLKKGAGNVLYALTRATSNGEGVVLKKYDGMGWVAVGAADLNPGGNYSNGNIEVNAAGIIYVAFTSNGQMRIKKFDGTTWSNVGGIILTDQIGKFSFTLDNNGIPHICYTRNDNTYVTKFNGTSWQLVQSFLNTSFGSIIFDNANNLYIAGASGIKKYDGSAWTDLPVTANMYLDVPRPLSIDQSGNPYVITKINNQPFTQIGVQKFSGGSWVTVTSELNTDYYVSNVQVFITSAGEPFLSYNSSKYPGSNLVRPMLKKWTGSSWTHLGSGGFSEAEPFFLKMAMNTAGDHYVICREWHDSLVLKKRDGTNWIKVSNPQVRTTGWVDITFNASGMLYLGYSNINGKPEVRKFDGTNWTSVGTLSIAGTVRGIDIKIHPDGTPYIAYYTAQNVYVYKFNGTSWVQVATTIQAIPQGAYPEMAFDNNGVLYLTILEDDYVRKLVGNSWYTVGDEVDYANQSMNLAFDNSNVPWIVYSSNTGGYTSAKKLSGNVWTPVGSSTGNVSDAQSHYSRLRFDANGVPYVMYVELVPGSLMQLPAHFLRMKKFNGTNWVAVGDRISTGEGLGDNTEHTFDFGFINGTTPLAVYHSGHAFAKTFGNTALPLSVLSFNGELQGNVSRFKWTTTGEADVELFFVERSENGSAFINRGSVPAKNMAGTNDYEFADDVNDLHSRQVFYRLKIMNKDGGFRYSKVIMLQLKVKALLVTLTGNPVSSELNLRVNVSQPGNIYYRVMSGDGRIASVVSAFALAGLNNVSIPVNGLAAGVYVLEVAAGGSASQLRFIKN